MQSQEPYVPPPSWWLALTEVHRVVGEVIALNISRRALNRLAPVGDGHGVMVLPGFLAGDGYNAALRRFLDGRGYAAHGWGMGQNLGPLDGVLERLEQRLHELASEHGPISLVGHSLGGIFARELARIYPDSVRQVISLGSPFGEGRMTASIPARLFNALNPSDELPVDEDLLPEAPPVPTTAIFSKGDGIVNWRTTYQRDGHTRTQSVRVRGSHCGMTFNPTIWYLLAERLAVPPEQWRPFERSVLGSLIYPSAPA